MWQAAAAAFTGLIAEEEIAGTLSVLFGGNPVYKYFTPLSGMSFLIFNLLCAPCFCGTRCNTPGNEQRKMDSFRRDISDSICLCSGICFLQFGHAAYGVDKMKRRNVYHRTAEQHIGCSHGCL